MSVPPSNAAAPAPPIASRLAPPRKPGGPVARPRLLQRIRGAEDAPVLLVHAPAGYGKTTLLAQFAAADPRPVAWLALDERDDDPVVFVGDLVHALRRAGLLDAAAPAAATAPGSGIVPVSLAPLTAWLSDRAAPLVIVLDDVHLLHSQGALDVLHALCSSIPPGSRLVLGSRTRPGLPLARLRAEGRMWELSAADLRMTRGEGADMLRAAGVELDTAEAAMVVEQTEGWAAAIYLASLVLRDPATAAVDVAPRADDEGLVEYVRDEVLAGADPADAEFLLRSSVLDDLTPDICDAVLHRADSAARLRDLARADLFVAASDTHRGAYRIHGLFRVMLQAQLRATDHRLALELHRRACAAYRTAGDLERATRHAVVAGDVPSAADLIWEAAPDLISQGRTATLRRRCSWLSQDDLVAHPQAMVARGWAALEDGEAELAAHCAAVACGADPQRTTSDGECIQAIGLLLRASIGAGGRTQALEDAARADAALQPDSPLRSPAAYIIGALSMLDGDPERARTRLVDAEQRAAGHLTTAYGLSLSQQALLDLEEGHWGRAERLADRAWAAQRNSEVRDYTTQALAVSVRALTLAHGGARSAGREEADRAARGLALLQPVIPWLALQTQLVLARARAELGDADQARALLRESLDAMDDDTSPLLRIWADRLTAQLNPYGDEADVATLSTAELRILQYLPTHLSLQEIGDRLHVSRNTVKTHAGAIYRKLGAASRSAAVDRGRELGLLE